MIPLARVRYWWVLFGIALAGAYLAGWQGWRQVDKAIMKSLPSFQVLQSTRVVAADSIVGRPGNQGTETVIGQLELGQYNDPRRSAERAHLRLRKPATEKNKPATENWTISNIARQRDAVMSYTGFGEISLKRWIVRDGDEIQINGHVLEVTHLHGSDTLALATENSSRRVDITFSEMGATAVNFKYPAESSITPLTSCKDPFQWWGWRAVVALQGKMKTWVLKGMRAFGMRIPAQTLIEIGGGVDCPTRMRLDGGLLDIARIVVDRGAILLRPGRNNADIRMRRAGARTWLHFSDIEWPLTQLSIGGQNVGPATQIIVGRSSYNIKTDANSVTFSPGDTHYLFLDANAEKNGETVGQPASPTNSAIPVISPLTAQEFQKLAAARTPEVLVTIRPFEASNTVWHRLWSKPSPLGLAAGAITFFAAYLLLSWQLRSLVGRPGAAAWLGVLARSLTMGVTALFSVTLLWEGGALADVSPLDLGWWLIALWTVTTLLIAWSEEVTLAQLAYWFAMSAVFAAGNLTITILSHTWWETRWIRDNIMHMGALSATFLMVMGTMSIKQRVWRSWLLWLMYNRSIRSGIARWSPFIVIGFTFVIWLGLGTEEGVFGIQPMEAGKLFFVLTFAVISSAYVYWQQSAAYHISWRKNAASMMYFLAFYFCAFLVIPGAKSDYSPIFVIVCVGSFLFIGVDTARVSRLLWSGWQNWRHGVGAAPGRLRRNNPYAEWNVNIKRSLNRVVRHFPAPYMLGGVVMLFAMGAFFSSLFLAVERDTENPNLSKGWLESLVPSLFEPGGLRVPWQRVTVFLDPLEYPELGAQLRSGWKAIAATPCYDWERQHGMLQRVVSWTSLDLGRSCAGVPEPSFGMLPPSLGMELPAVQNDFIMALFINRFGHGGVTLLLLAQFTIIAIGLWLPVRKYTFKIGDYCDDAIRRTLCFATFGGTLLYAFHWMLSWGNVLGALPVMGQPMTWISSATSHNLFMAAPVVLITLQLARLPDRRPPPPLSRRELPQVDDPTLLGLFRNFRRARNDAL